MWKTFSIGGIHPQENKLSANHPIHEADLPKQAVIMLSQHIGAPAKPIVRKGDRVKVGTRIAEPGGFVSAAIHSSVSGQVVKIDQAIDASGYPRPAVFIDVEGDEWEAAIDRDETLIKDCPFSPEEILQKIADAGNINQGLPFQPRRDIAEDCRCRHRRYGWCLLPLASEAVPSSPTESRMPDSQCRGVRTLLDSRPPTDA